MPALALCALLAGATPGPFTLPDPVAGRDVTSTDLAAGKPLAVVFVGTACPVNNAYMPKLNRLRAEFAGKATLVAVNSNRPDTAERIAEHAKKHALTFPVLRDADGAVAARFGARRTPEAFVLDAAGVVRYRGRIDDQYGITGDGFDVKKLQATTDELGDALRALVAGRPVAVAETVATGCVISRPPTPKAGASVTYYRDIAPLVSNHCLECHRAGQIGPMALSTYEEVADWSETIREVVDDRRMPPWYADSKPGHFSNDRSLPEDARKLVMRWVDDGCPKGDAADAPPAKTFPSGEWRIGTPDRIFRLEKPQRVPAEMPKRGVPYQVFVLDPGLTEDVWVQAAEARATAPAVVHHILAFVAPPPDRIDPDIPDFPFLPGVKNARVLAGTAPGDMPTIYPPGVGQRIPAGSQLVIQMHYTPNGKEEFDQSEIGVKFCKTPPARQVLTIPVFNGRVRIPPGEPNYRMDSYYQAKHNGQILSYMPHMHVRGKDFRIARVREKREEDLLVVPRYNFNWQNVYRLSEPLSIKQGDVIHCTAHYDNSANNPNNPDPKREVRWGDQTWEEMMIGWLDLVYDIPVRP